MMLWMANARMKAAIRILPRIEKLKICLDIAEYNGRWTAARACAMSLMSELFRHEAYEQIGPLAERCGFNRTDIESAKKAALKTPVPAKMTEAELQRLIVEYAREETKDEFEARIKNEIKVIIQELDSIQQYGRRSHR